MGLFDKLALEDSAGTNKEIEIVIYAEIGDFEGLRRADFTEEHEQLETSFIKGQRCRCRKVTTDHKVEHFITFKIPTEGTEGAESYKEVTSFIDADFFEQFKAVAERSLKKIRYTFNSEKVELSVDNENERKTITIPNVQYEVDVYTGKDGGIINWCKIDIEVDSVLDYLNEKFPDIDGLKLNLKVSHLPFKPTNSILSTTTNEDQQNFIHELWEKFNLTP